MQRNKKSILNAISAMALSLCNGLFGLVVVKMIITYFGSDFNGLNSTASQIVTILMLLEGGFTVATNVALFKPYATKDYDKVNAIISATRSTFQKIGIISMGVGIAISLGYSFVINSNLPRVLVFSIFLMTILPVCFNFYYATKYRILLQAEQKEYIISLITLITTVLGYIVNIFAMQLGCSMWTIRFTTMIFAIINSLTIGLYVKQKYRFLNLKQPPDFKAVQGTKDVFAQKLTGVFYSTAPIVSITLTAGGTMLASVYAVYNSIFVLLKGILHAVIDAPRLGLGELIAADDKKNVWRVFQQYQLIINWLLFAFIATAAALIMPFINIYTKGINDINYRQPLIALLLVLICYFELIHIPSGHLLNMSGSFKISRNFQIIACFIMCSGILLTLSFRLGIYGILSSVLLTAICLCVLEIGFIHTKYFEGKIRAFLRMSLPTILVAIPLIFIEINYLPSISGYINFGIIGIAVFLINVIIGFLITLISNYQITLAVMKRFFMILKRK